MIVFSSGSCRIGFPLTYLHCEKKIELIDPHWDARHPDNQIGDADPIALGHLHNITEHYRMFKLLEDDSDQEELFYALHMINQPKSPRYREDWLDAWDHCKSLWPKCDVVVIEISSVKPVRKDLPPTTIQQTIVEMQNIEEMLADKKVLWVSHFRPKIIYEKANKKWDEAREKIYQAVATGTNFFDPSPYLKDHTLLRDQNHYSPKGIKEIGWKFLEKIESICDNIF